MNIFDVVLKRILSQSLKLWVPNLEIGNRRSMLFHHEDTKFYFFVLFVLFVSSW